MKSAPLVSIICTTYNQASFIGACLDHIAQIDYTSIELIIIDNGSTDQTQANIQDWVKNNPQNYSIRTFFHLQSLPYCECFMRAVELAEGKYLIDLAGDDLILKDHLNNAVRLLEKNQDAAFCFSDAWIEENGRRQKFYDSHKIPLQEFFPAGALFTEVIKGNPILSATLIFNKTIFLKIGGYDTRLTYEDFDILVRLTRDYSVVFSNLCGINKAVHSKAFSKMQYLPRQSTMLSSTVLVCEKLLEMVQTFEEKEALKIRVRHELKHALWSANFDSADGFIRILSTLKDRHLYYTLMRIWGKLRLDLSWLYLILKKP